jgi:hypothetical protein
MVSKDAMLKSKNLEVESKDFKARSKDSGTGSKYFKVKSLDVEATSLDAALIKIPNGAFPQKSGDLGILFSRLRGRLFV